MAGFSPPARMTRAVLGCLCVLATAFCHLSLAYAADSPPPADAAATRAPAKAGTPPAAKPQPGQIAAITAVPRPVERVPAPSHPALLNLSINPFNELTLDKNQPATSQGLFAGPDGEPTGLGNRGAVFMPLIKQTPRAQIDADPLARGDFAQRHEFGIELRSPF